MKKNRFNIILISWLVLLSCQHARVGLAPALVPPAERKNPTPGDPSMERREDLVIVHQRYYVFGLFPREESYEERRLCPTRGIREIHQYDSASDLVLEQLTFGLYSPRTLVIRCY